MQTPPRSAEFDTEILLEIALATGSSLDLRAMLGRSIPVFARKLNCAMAGVVDAAKPQGPALFSRPLHLETHPAWQAALRRIFAAAPVDPDSVLRAVECEGLHFYGAPLSRTGWLVFGRRLPFRAEFLRNLEPVIALMGRSCDACHDFRLRLESEAAMREALDAAVSASASKSNFLATMSHEIRTPLNGVIGMAELLAGSALDAEQGQTLALIRSSARHLLDILNDTLELSRLDARAVQIESIAFDLHEEIGSTVATVSGIARAKSLPIDVQVDPAAPRRVLGDPLRLRQVLFNLLGNAVKFTERGSIRLQVSVVDPPSAGHIAFRVTDSGIGIAADRLETIFEAFSQADQTVSRRYGGTGLGLTISWRLVELMGGRLTVRSAPGQGSEFSFELPLPPAVATPAAASEPVPAPGAEQALRILLAEDNEVNRLLAMRILARRGHTVVPVENGALALERLGAESFDIVLMDVMMPVLDGLQAARQVRTADRDWSGIPIVALTANAFSEDRKLCLAAGMDGYVAKPFSAEALLREIHRVMHERAP